MIAIAFPITRFARANAERKIKVHKVILVVDPNSDADLFLTHTFYSVPDFLGCHTKRGFQYCVYQFYITHK